MSGLRKQTSLPGIEAFHRAIHVRPLTLSEGSRLPGSIISIWKTGNLGEYEIPPMREPMIGLHTGGVPRFQTRIGGRWMEPSLPGQLYWIPSDLPTIWRVNGHLEFVAIHFRGEALRRIGLATGVPADEAARLPFRPGFHDGFAGSACAVLAEEVGHPTGGRSAFADLLADTLGVYLVRSTDRPQASPTGRTLPSDVLKGALDRIERSIACGVTVDELAREAGMSPSVFARAFKESMRVSPHRYLTRRRVEIGKHLLGRTHFPIADIALETGFSSQAHFTYQFRRETGRTPLEFRRLGTAERDNRALRG